MEQTASSSSSLFNMCEFAGESHVVFTWCNMVDSAAMFLISITFHQVLRVVKCVPHEQPFVLGIRVSSLWHEGASWRVEWCDPCGAWMRSNSRPSGAESLEGLASYLRACARRSRTETHRAAACRVLRAHGGPATGQKTDPMCALIASELPPSSHWNTHQ